MIRPVAAGLRRLARHGDGTLLAVTAVAWLALVAGDATMAFPMLCSDAGPGPGAALGAVDLLLRLRPPADWLLPAALMTVAMMLPMQLEPLSHVRARSLASRRIMAQSLFVAGYGTVWVACLFVITVGADAARSLLPDARFAMLAAALGAALVWHGTRIRARLLARCGARPTLRAFGLAAERDAVGFGLVEGWRCVRLCSPLMLAAMLTGGMHLAAMAAAGLALFAERCGAHREPGRRVSWQAVGAVLLAVGLTWIWLA